MRIQLTQHGLAVPKTVDPDRPLSEQGREDVRHLTDFLDKAGIPVGQVLHSGKTRAEQTAAILAEALLPEGQPQAHASLGPKDPLEKVSPEIAFWSVPRTDIASGALLLTAPAPVAGRIRAALEQECIPCTEIGKVTAGPPQVLQFDGSGWESSPLPERDGLAQVFESVPETKG
jgi:phosphohistidine phosphatase SixA